MSAAVMPAYEWKSIPWKTFQRKVYKLQTRIYRASRRGDVRTVHRLQRLLMKSFAAKCLAVRKVTQDNRGKKQSRQNRHRQGRRPWDRWALSNWRQRLISSV